MTSASHKPRTFAPYLQRVLLVDASLPSTRMTAEVLKDLGAVRIYTETSDAQALLLCKQIEPQIIITELTGPNLDGLRFVRSLRRSNLRCRAAPVIVATSDPTESAINGARNSGVHEILRRPFAIRDLTRRLEAVTLRGRDWIEGIAYIGPDRRRFNSGDYQGPRKRLSDIGEPGPNARIEQALRILISAIKAIESDPAQALRSMQAQAADLSTVAASIGDIPLMSGASALKRALAEASTSGVLSRAAIESSASALLAFLPADQGDVRGEHQAA